MPADMRCLSPRQRDHMPDGTTPEGPGARPLVGEVLAAIEGYAERAKFEVRLGTSARALIVEKKQMTLKTSHGLIATRRLIVATGEYARPFELPLRGRFSGPIQHARTFEPWSVGADERVCVVGAGNSGAETCAALARRGIRVTLSTSKSIGRPASDRTGLLGELFWWASGLPNKVLLGGGCTQLTPIVDPDLHAAVSDGRVTVVAGAAGLLPSGVLTTSGQEVACDRIVLATGYRRDTEWLDGVLTRDIRGVPLHREGISPEVQGVGFIGIACMRTRRSGFLRGMPGDARWVMKRLKAGR